MGHVPLLDELAIVAALAVLVTVVLSRLRLPTVAGLLASGALLGPFGLGLVDSVHAMEVLAEVGVVLLLFTIGLEFSLSRIRDVFRQAAFGGLLQVGLTAGLAGGVAAYFGEPLGRSVLYGFVFALSSTAIILRALSQRQELAAPHGRFIVGTLIFQDLCVVPMMLIVPLLGKAAGTGDMALELGLALGKAALVVVGTVGLSRFLVPYLLRWVDASRSREVFLLAILGLCIGTAWLTSLAGLSLALGAFLGGMVVADTEYGHRAMGDILPLRDAFVSIFFVSLGMLFDVRILWAHPWVVFAFLFGFVVLKGLVATVAALLMKFPPRAAWLSGVGLAQFGEFGFVLTGVAEESGVATREQLGPMLTAGILSMFLAPQLLSIAPRFTVIEKWLAPFSRLLGPEEADSEKLKRATHSMSQHVVVVGYGVAGKLAAETLTAARVPFVVLELNSQNVRNGRQKGVPIFNADSTSLESLEHAHVHSARLVVILINDPQAVRRVVDAIRHFSPETPVVVRTRYLAERAPLLDLGARDAVAEEVEGAVEVIARMLRWLEAPRNVIEQQIRRIRTETQSSERKQTLPRNAWGQMKGLAELKIESLLMREGARGCGRSVAGLSLRTRTGALVVAVQRDGELLEPFDPHVPFKEGDIVYLAGRSEALAVAAAELGATNVDGDPASSEAQGAAHTALGEEEEEETEPSA